LFEIRKQKVYNEKEEIELKSIYVDLRTKEKIDIFKEKYKDFHTVLLTLEDVKDENDEFAELNEFFLENKKCFLIHGPAGSGKSTISRKIEEFLWYRYD
jgi:DNA replication protein DnaC